MENNSTESTTEKNSAPQETVGTSGEIYYFVYLLSGLCVICSLGFWAAAKSADTESLWGYYSARAIWDGAYWAYLTSCFVHGDIVHIYFNLYWLFILGKPFEKEFGFFKSCIFFICLAVVSSGLQFRISEDTGIGLSGVIYGLFAFMWAAKSKYKSFERLITPRLVKMFLTWLVLCYVLSFLGVWDVGNTAHLAGLVFGWLAGRAYGAKKQAVLSTAVLSCTMIAALLPLFWMPSSIHWVNEKAYKAAVKKDFQGAQKWFSKSIEMDPNDAWAYYGRAAVYDQLGRKEESQRDFEKIRQLDPGFYKEMMSAADPNIAR